MREIVAVPYGRRTLVSGSDARRRHTHTHTRPAKSKGHETGKVCVKQRVWPRDEHDKMPVVTRE